MAEQQAPINKQTFDYQAFVKELATQADGLVPVDIADNDKKYVTNIVYNFCNLACEAVLKENFTVEEATLITQFIGEWTFHKSIDLIRANIAPQFRDSVLQKIAFTVFEIAKQAITKKLSQPQIIQVVEHHVKKAYMDALTELKEKNLISPADFDAALGQSNIDKMAQENEEQGLGDEFSDSKILKLATFAMLLKQMAPEKATSIISKFSQKEADILIDYMNMEDLSSKIDSTITMKYISEIKSNVPKATQIKGDKLQYKLAKIVTKQNKSKIDDIILFERDGIKKYISNLKDKHSQKLPSRISNVVYSHLMEKLNA